MSRVTGQALAAKFGVSSATVSRWCQQYGFARHKVNRTDLPPTDWVVGASWHYVYDLDEVLEKMPVRVEGDRTFIGGAALERQRVVDLALDVVDLERQAWGGDVTLDTWSRVCAARLERGGDPVTTSTSWRTALAKLGVKVELVDEFGEPHVASFTSGPALMRFDWPSALTWAEGVLDAA